MLISSRTANGLWRASALGDALAWRRSTRRVRATQEQLLRGYLAANWDTAFGREHGFGRIASVAEYQARVPVRAYGELLPWVERALRGEPRVLTAEPVERFVLSSGSTAATKFIPYTRTLRREFQRAISPWITDLFRHYPAATGGPAYWSLSPACQTARTTEGGIPLGFDDTDYLGLIGGGVQRTLLAVPTAVSAIPDIDTFRYVTLRLMLGRRDLALISVWNPTFLSLLLEPLSSWGDALVEDLRRGTVGRHRPLGQELRGKLEHECRPDPRRADEVREALAAGAEEAVCIERLWPNLALISCWGDGAAAPYLEQLQRHFPSIPFQRKGLIATEAFVSFPLGESEVSALAARSHFFEFQPVDSPEEFRLADDLEPGRRYAVVLTTGGGFYRYRLNDVVEVTGWTAECPLLRFVGRADRTVDLFGEKLNEEHVVRAVEAVLAGSGVRPRFWMMAPEVEGAELSAGSGAYVLYVQTAQEEKAADWARIGRELDSMLSDNFHYNYARRLGQLHPAQVFLISSGGPDPAQLYLNHCAALGQTLGAIKPARLHAGPGWGKVFSGGFSGGPERNTYRMSEP